MDASQYKDYVLVLLFIKYVSDKYSGMAYAPITIPKGAGFKDMIGLKGKSDIGDQINKKIIAPLANANKLSDMPDFNDATKLGSGKEMVDRLTNLIAIFKNPALDFSKNRADGDDILGDAYEYLMRHFATESGKSKGQFYTPAEVSRVLAQILDIRHAKTSNNTTVCDPTCGSGSLLLKVGDEATAPVTLYGQEKDSATAGLARMNMILHNQPSALIVQGNTLANPQFKEGHGLKLFDYVVANPPFSDKRWSTGLDPADDPYQRFKHYGVPPARQGDYAYLLHIVATLKPQGKGACILPHGVLFRGNAEAVIRKNLLQRGYIKGIIGLPANLFYGTGIPACIIVLDKEHAAGRKGIFMIDAAKGFIKDGNKNRLRSQDIHKIVDAFIKQKEIPRYSRMVSLTEISDPRNDYNLNLPRYIDTAEPEDLQDINAHLHGGIPDRDIAALDSYWQVFPGLRSALFKKTERAGYCQLEAISTEIQPAILNHAEFRVFNEAMNKLFQKWKTNVLAALRAIDQNTKPKALIENLAEDLLRVFGKAHLLDAYDVYQHLLDYWSATMQDDVYMIVSDGWRKAAEPRRLSEEKGNKGKEKPDFILGKGRYKVELVPVSLVINRYFSVEQAALHKAQAAVDAVQQELEEWVEEHGGEEGLLAEARNDKDKITKASVLARLKEVDLDADATAEREALNRYLSLVEKEAVLTAKVKEDQVVLTAKLVHKYGKLTEAEIKTLVIEDKWLAGLTAAVQGELDRVSQTLTTRIRQLAERYAVPLPQLIDQVAALSKRVDGHLQNMGATWK